MRLRELLVEVQIIEIKGSQDIEIDDLQIDSRKIKNGALFAALAGTQVNGHKFIELAIENGAKCILCEEMPDVLNPSITYVRVEDSATTIGLIAHVFFGRSSEQLNLVGVTGTNGKTTVATLLFRLFQAFNYHCGLISTIEYKIGDQSFESSHTTPDVINLHRLLSQMKVEGCTHVFMEVSSHAIDQKRIAGLRFTGGIFTNLSHDHLDYHGTFKEYIHAKKLFFDGLSDQAFALVNADDSNGSVMVQNTSAKVSNYTLNKFSEFKARIIENSIEGLYLELNGVPIHSRLIGRFNAYNLCAVYGAAILLGEEQEELLRQLSNLAPAEGRFDLVKGTKKDVYGIVDYAHTPDALQKVLSTLVQMRKQGQRIITLAGCGGDRDRQKRPKMAKVVASMSDVPIFTSDNPRSEDPEKILEEMMTGIDEEAKEKVLLISNRKQAIKTAVMLAKKGDMILVAGKGHEKYQEIKGVKYPFDDMTILKQELMDIQKTKN
jgi:UDP-N-acetylmuramoyl-L-alanyl-D-glutamate--2,6-diaminopimelate ligase